MPRPSVELRHHPRAQVRMPARLRWRGPLGMRLETASTVDVARGGLMVERTERCEVDSHIWVAFPFDVVAPGVQPETPARIMRVDSVLGGGFRVALRLERPLRSAERSARDERRASPRIPFALPIFVRPFRSPWPEESMTQDVSRHGARFTTTRIFAPGDSLLAKIPWGEWAQAGEIPGRVVRVATHDDSPEPAPLADPENGASAMLTCVSVEWRK
ncbi:MAG: PilZ domain-containing protein [Candidatus Acidiferrales bacterium]